MRHWFRWILLLVALAAVGAVVWLAIPAGPMPEVDVALFSDDDVDVRRDDWLTFSAVDGTDTGLIFYPGARVHPESYAPAAHEIAAEGYLVVIVPMPLNLAVLNPNRAGEVIDAHPEIEHWVMGGHSLGGAMAVRYTRAHPDRIGGLVLWGAYPGVGTDLSARTLPVTSLYGTADCLTTVEEIEEARRLLPAETEYVPIEGGNHAQFGWYGEQRGDCAATIDRREQQDAAVAATVELLAEAGR